MPSLLLPPAIAAEKAMKLSVELSRTAEAAAAGYGAAIAPVIANIVAANGFITAIQTPLSLSGAVAPPSLIGVNITAAVFTQLTAISAGITATIPQSVAVAGAPSPSFPISAALVTTQIDAVATFIKKFLVDPQK
jgi:hypothetical protein